MNPLRPLEWKPIRPEDFIGSTRDMARLVTVKADRVKPKGGNAGNVRGALNDADTHLDIQELSAS